MQNFHPHYTRASQSHPKLHNNFHIRKLSPTQLGCLKKLELFTKPTFLTIHCAHVINPHSHRKNLPKSKINKIRGIDLTKGDEMTSHLTVWVGEL
jgi:hypothetical protein